MRVAVSRSLWTTWIWPLVAGAVAAIGVSAASNVFGWLVLGVVYAVTSLTTIPFLAVVWIVSPLTAGGTMCESTGTSAAVPQ